MSRMAWYDEQIEQLKTGDRWPYATCEQSHIYDLCRHWSQETQHHLFDGKITVVIQEDDNSRYILEVCRPGEEPDVTTYMGWKNMLWWIEQCGFDWSKATLVKRTRKYPDLELRKWVVSKMAETHMEYVERRDKESKAHEEARITEKWLAYKAARDEPQNVVTQTDETDTHASDKRSVYFICNPSTQRIKIGISRQVKERLRALESSAGTSLELLAVIDGGRERERELHEKFAHLRRMGEWFEPQPDLLSYIDRLKESGFAS